MYLLSINLSINGSIGLSITYLERKVERIPTVLDIGSTHQPWCHSVARSLRPSLPNFHLDVFTAYPGIFRPKTCFVL